MLEEEENENQEENPDESSEKPSGQDEERDIDDLEEDGEEVDEDLENVIPVSGMYKEWFLDYASYVILERAVPNLRDGFKPVQRRILHSMKELEDGRYNKVANVIGNTMKYHPHGDASIGDAMVQIGQKDLLIDMQGNWGNVYTGDRAAAPRYIEARLSKFALDVCFSPKVTNWVSSYDGRNKEPVTLPMKFPLLLAQGAEGIAVGMACKIMPHNFNELIDESIKALKGKKTNILPDFYTGGLADFSNYNDGLRGGKIRLRARINKADNKTLEITEIPYGTNTSSLIDSILKANDKGKIKIKKIEDNTAEFVSILIHLAANISPDKTIDALYAFTDCEVSISPNTAVILDDRPYFMGVNEVLKYTALQTKDVLMAELEIKKSELEEQWHFASLEKIFIENRIYRDIEECETWEAVIEAIDKGLKPFTKHLIREVTEEDIVRLTEIKIKRISKFDTFKADEIIAKIEAELDEVKHHIENIVDYAIEYYKRIKKKYGEGRERKTEIRTFDTIDARKVVVNNQKLYVNRTEGFIGHGMKKDEYVCDCSDIDDIIVFRNDGVMVVTRISNKAFVGKDIIHVAVWKKGDDRTIYNLIYKDGASGPVMVKRFPVTGVTRDKEYDLCNGKKGSKLLYFTANPNGEAEVVNVQLKSSAKTRKLGFDFDFAKLAIKGRGAKGNILSKYPVSKIVLKKEGVSTLSAQKIWFDDTVSRLNTDERGTYLGQFSGDDKILTVTQSGFYQLFGFGLSTHFEEDMILIEKWNPNKPLSAIYWDQSKKQYNIKRFLVEPTDRKVSFIPEEEGNFLEIISSDWIPMVKLDFSKSKGKEIDPEEINVAEFIQVKGLKAIGNRLTDKKVKNIDLLEPLPYDEPEDDEDDDTDSNKKQPSLFEEDEEENEVANEDTDEEDDSINEEDESDEDEDS